MEIGVSVSSPVPKGRSLHQYHCQATRFLWIIVFLIFCQCQARTLTCTRVSASAIQNPQLVKTPAAALALETISIKIELSTNTIQFFQSGRPGLLAPQQTVEMRVTSYAGPWSVAAKATSLVEQQGRHQIAPERLFIRSGATQANPDGGAGPGFVPLNTPVIVATGSTLTFSTPLEFRLLTLWEDTPGVYSGTIQFTAVVTP